MGRRRLGNGKLERLVPANLRGGVANRDRGYRLQRSAADQRLEPFAGQSWNRIGKRTVQPPTRMARQKLDADDLVAPHVLDMGINSGRSMTCLTVKLA